ncbi:hypothetical protein EG328_003026 [Venturia inaequalis]|uniref:Uncharacterized protein n=1 Tax=Venturia inaequalis TaxID=5025 RepID=A0A8H3UVU8_VENIN|nr:hypothetical protein EG328_003026 [Venturia inaequalis]
MSSPYKWLRRPWRWPLELLLISVLTTESAAQRSNSSSNSCYYPSGIISPGKPCHPNANNSVCCGPGFECLGNGICQTSPLIDTPYKHTLYRSACTDPTFQDPACPHFCVGADDNPQAGQGMQVCSPELGTYCCKRDYDCCTNSTLVYTLGKPEVVAIIPNHTANPTSPPVSAATHTPSRKDNTRDSTEIARNAIIGVGAGLAAAMSIFIIGCCFWLTKRRPSERYRDGDRKSNVFEMDAMDGSRLTIHKETSFSVSQLDTQSPQAEIDAPTRLELDTRRATIINQVVEMLELDASPTDEGRRPDESLARDTIREGPSLEEIPPPQRRAPDIPNLEASPLLAPLHSQLYSPGSRLSIPEIFMSATARRPVSEFTPVADRVPTPLPDTPEPESSNDIPPIPTSPSAISLPERPTARKYSVGRPLTAKPYESSRKSETTPFQGGSQTEAEALARPGPSGPSLRRSILKTTTPDALRRNSETTPVERFEAVPDEPVLGPSPSPLQKVGTGSTQPSSSAASTLPKAVTEVSAPQPAASTPDEPSPETKTPPIPSPEHPAPQRPPPEKPAPEHVSKPD